MSKCLGCGITIQNTLIDEDGYSPKLDSKYCQRCFRIKNYGEIKKLTPILDDKGIINKVKQYNTLLLVIDLLDFNYNNIKNLNINSDIIILLTKRDLLPKIINDDKLIAYIYKQLEPYNLKIIKIIITGKKSNYNDIFNQISSVCKNDIVLLGNANAGKSTLLNRLNYNNNLTVSKYPNTTIEFNKLCINNINFIDTPGVTNNNSVLNYLDNKDFKYIVPLNTIKPRVYQIYQDQSFALGGIAKVDIKCHKTSSIVFYVSNNLLIHRGKLDNSIDLWDNHFNEYLIPTINNDYNSFKEHTFLNVNEMDIFISGLGWINFKGHITSVKINIDNNIDVILRKELI